jgi:ankyrin repeat protein
LKSGAVVDSVDHDGVSVLQAAVIAGHVDICALLLHHGADPDHLDADEESPRSCAEGDDDMMTLFQTLESLRETE